MTDPSDLEHLSPDKRELLDILLQEDSADQVPLSFAQQRLWFLQQLEPDSPQYNLPSAVRLRGRLDIGALWRSLNTLVERHEILRTTFPVVNGEPVQLIAPALELDLPLVDLRGQPEADHQQMIRRYANEEASRPFDLARGPLLRVTLLWLAEGEYVLLLTKHHIITDGWSVSIFISELATLYDADVRGRRIVLPELPIQYADYTLWQHEQLRDGALDAQLDYWKRKLAGPLPLLALPTDHPRPAIASQHGAMRTFRTNSGLSAALLELSRHEGVTPFMLLLSAYAVLLHRYTGQPDLLIGTPIAGRTMEELEPLLGFFVNTLVLRVDLTGAPSFRELLGRVRQMTLEAYDHQQVPFEQLVEALQPERSLSHTPLFQTMFVFHTAELPSIELPDLALELVAVDSGTSKFDLRFSAFSTQSGLYWTVEYRTDLFEDATITRMIGHLETLLAGIVDRPDQPISELALLSPEEQRVLLDAGDGGAPAVPPERCFHELFAEQAAQSPDATALVFEGRRVSYAELERRANGLAHHLRALGVGPEARVGIYAERSTEQVIALLAVLKAGGAYVPLDPDYPPERLALILEDAGALAVVAQPDLSTRLPGRHPVILLDEHSLAERPEAPASGAGPGNLAYVLYTSGSTGQPKGVAVTHRGVHNLATALDTAVYADLPAGPLRISLNGPLSFDTSVKQLVQLLRGHTLEIVPRDIRLDPTALGAWLQERAVDVLDATPSQLRLLLEVGLGPFPRCVLAGGEAIDPLLWDQLAADPARRCYNLYGPTECTVDTTIALVCGASPTIGRPVRGAQVFLLDQAMQPVPIGVPGELYIGGAGVARGYLNRPDLTAERFVPNPFGAGDLRLEDAELFQASRLKSPASRLYRTGDLARWLPDGSIEYLGRSDHQVKIRGFRIELGEIEAVLAQHRSVREAVVLAREDRPGEKRLVAYIVPSQESSGDASGLRLEARTLNTQHSTLKTFLQERLPDYMVPSALLVLEALPLTPNGKLDRRALPPPDGQDEPATRFVAPRTPVEELVAGIWQALLPVEQVGVHDNFFELGGHSLLATQVILRLRAALQVDLPVRTLFEAPTVAALAERAALAAKASPPPPIDIQPRDHDLPLSYPQERLWFLHQMEPLSPAYNLPYFTRLRGPLDRNALARSLGTIVQRHAVLRTTFATAGGLPVQRIGPAWPVELPVIDLSDLPAGEREEQARAISQAEASRPFDLSSGPLLRAVLVQQGHDDALLLLTLHHIVTDAWSRAVLTRELSVLYAAELADRPATLPELPVQYADYAAWQRRWLAGEQFQQQLDYWRGTLAGLAPLDLPTDRPRPVVQTTSGAALRFRLEAGLVAALRELSRREDVTPFMLLLATFQTVLSRYSRQSNIAVGSPVANRSHPEVEDLIGCFINVLVLRTDLGGDPSFRQLLARVREVTLGAYAHQDVPFERLVEELAQERDLSRSPLVQVMFMFQNAPSAAPELPGLTVEPAEAEGHTAKYELTLALAGAGDELDGVIEYNTDLFDAATIARLAGHFQTLLAGALADPDLRLSELPLLPAAEHNQIVRDWNATALAFPVDRCIHELIAEQAARTPEATALVFGEQALTYAELDARASRLARRLSELGARPDGLVGICMERSVDLAVAVLGVLKAGAAYLPLDPHYPTERLRQMLEDARPLAVLTNGAMVQSADLAQTLAGGPWALIDLAREVEPPPEAIPAAVQPEHLAYVIYTSGSTGRPKGVMVSHRNVVNFFSAMDRSLGGPSGGTWLAVTSISFDISVLELLWTLARGFKVVIQPERSQLYSGATAGTSPARALDFSLFYFASGEQDGNEQYRLLLEGAKFADQHGFRAVWTPERHFHSFGASFPNPSVVSAALAVTTTNIQIRAGSVVLPLQNPLRVAEEWAVVDVLSRGRAGVSFASGWHANDFVLAPGNYANRKQVMLRDIEVVRRLWRGEAVEQVDGAGQTIPVRVHPRPVQPELPFWLTASGNPETFRAAGALGANLLTHLLGQTVDELADKIALYRQAWREHGHPGEGQVTLMLHTFIGADMEEVRRLVRRPFGEYLKTSLDLWKNLARSLGHDIDAEHFTEEEEEVLLTHAFNRYAQSNGLIGTPDSCLTMVERLKAIGVDEVGCLIDFGVPAERVLESLELLDQLRQRSNAPVARFDPETHSVAAQIRRHSVTHLQCTPSMARMLLSEPDAAALGELHLLLLGGEALPGPLAAELEALLPGRVLNMYGPTETTVWSAAHPVAAAGATVPIGRPVANTEIYILDRSLRPVPCGVPGELYIGGAGVTRGYLNRPELTAERFVPNPFGEGLETRNLRLEVAELFQASSLKPQASRLYRTGDLARYRSDGVIEFLGRVDQQIKLGGHRIELGEIEAVLAQHPLVQEAAVALREDTPGSPYLAAYVVPRGRRARVLRPVLPPDEQAALLARHRHYTLPNGMVIAQLNDLHAINAYREVIEEASYLRHGVTLNDGDCVVDAGANIGSFTLFANLVGRNVKVYAFEPIPPTFEVLRANVTLYGLDVKLFPMGLSHSRETVEFTFYPEMAGLSGRYSEALKDQRDTRAIILQTLRDNQDKYGPVTLEQDVLDEVLDQRFRSERYLCQLTTLSDIIREQQIERIDLLKIDVEKAELDVIRGIKDEDWARIKQVAMEVDTHEHMLEIRAILERQGFRVAVDDLVIVEALAGEPGVYVYMLYATRLVPGASGEATAVQPVLTPTELRTYLQQRLPDSMVPSAVQLLESLPRTPNGKLNRSALPALTVQRSALAVEYVAPATELEQSLAGVWRELLRVERVGLHDNFFELGGSSLLIVQLRTRLREALGLEVSLVDLFRFPTISSLAGHLGARQPATSAVSKARARAEKQLSRRQRRSDKGNDDE
ncbi:MAG: hypothetical protein OHK0022_06410 [Roseiflexaceae bacterium]